MHISIRLDDDATRALEYLERTHGRTRSEVVRDALLHAAADRFRPSVLRVEAERLAADPAYRAEVAALMSEWDVDDAAW